MKHWLRIRRQFVAALMTSVIMAVTAQPSSAAVEKMPYMIYEGQNTTMTVLWQMTSTQSCTLEWGLDTNYSLGSVVTSEYGNDHQHKHMIAGLTPGTKYYYNVVGVGSGSFTSAPADSATKIKILAYGDTRDNPTGHNDVVEQIVNAYTQDPEFQTICLFSGDYIGVDTESQWSNQWFPLGYQSLMDIQSSVPINGCIGNHEGTGAVFKKYYPFPHVDRFYWSFDYGPVHVIMIDQYTDYSVGSAQYNWLVNDLEANTKEWIFMVYHHPGWSAGGNSNKVEVQDVLQPLAEQYGVDLMINGHNHYYSRCSVNGVQHIVTGGGGAPLYNPSSTAENLVVAESARHYMEITVDGDLISTVTRRLDGTILDRYDYAAVPTAPAWYSDPVEADTAGSDKPYSGNLNAYSYDPNGDTMTYAKISGPSWLTVASDGSLSGTPTSADLGENTFVCEVTDGISGSTTATVRINVVVQTIHEAEDAASFDCTSSSYSAGYTGSGYVVMTNAGSSYIEWTVNQAEAGDVDIAFHHQTDYTQSMNLRVNGVDSSYTMVRMRDEWGYTPKTTISLNAGANTIRLTRDSGGNSVRMDRLLVEELPTSQNGAPTFTVDPISKADAVDGVAYSASIANDASDPEGDSLSFAKVSGPTWLSVAANGALSGIPGTTDVGQNTFSVQVNATGGSDVATLSINVLNAQDTTIYEAEDAASFDCTSSSYSAGYTGSGYVVMTNAGSSYIEWTVNQAAAGSADLSFQHYSNYTNTMTLTVNGVVVDSNFTLDGGSTWQMSGAASAALNAGANTIRLTRDSGADHVRVDHLLVGGAAQPNQAPAFTVDPINEANATENIAYSGSVANATDADGDPLTYSKATGPAWLSVAADGSLSGTPGDSDVGANAFTVQVSDGKGGSDSAALNITVDEFMVADQAVSGVQTLGTSSGTLDDSSSSDDVYQVLTESGDPSALEYEWTFNVFGGELVTFYVEAYHTANSEGDNFVFAYSTNGTDYTEMGTVVDTVDDDTASLYAFPSGLSGAVYVRVEDTDRTVGNNVADSLYVDEIIIVSEDSTVAPNPANTPVPADGSVDVVIDQDLAWIAGAMTASHDVYFGTNPTPGGAEFQGNQSGTTFDPGTLAYSTTYYWAIAEVNLSGTTAGPIWSFTTEGAPSTLHVSNIVVVVNSRKGSKQGEASVTVVDSQEQPVSGAIVTGSFSGDQTLTASATTDANGVAVLLTNTQGGRLNVTFCVDDIIDASLSYDQAANVETCDSN